MVVEKVIAVFGKGNGKYEEKEGLTHDTTAPMAIVVSARERLGQVVDAERISAVVSGARVMTTPASVVNKVNINISHATRPHTFDCLLSTVPQRCLTSKMWLGNKEEGRETDAKPT